MTRLTLAAAALALTLTTLALVAAWAVQDWPDADEQASEYGEGL